MMQYIPQYILLTTEDMIAGVTNIFTNALWHRCQIDAYCIVMMSYALLTTY